MYLFATPPDSSFDPYEMPTEAIKNTYGFISAQSACQVTNSEVDCCTGPYTEGSAVRKRSLHPWFHFFF
jgi:hypothetical protein